MSLRIENAYLLPGLVARVGRAVQAKKIMAVEKKLRHGFEILLERTPVWSGDTVANYVVTAGLNANMSYTPYNQEQNPLGKDFVGGSRDEAEAHSRASLEAGLARWKANGATQLIYITNNIKYDTGEGIEALEHGSIGRQAYGMFAAAKDAMEALDVSGV